MSKNQFVALAWPIAAPTLAKRCIGLGQTFVSTAAGGAWPLAADAFEWKPGI